MQKYNCKECGAELYWDSNANCLKCEYCDSEYQVSDFESADTNAEEEASTQKKEPEKADEHAKATDDSVSVDLVVYKCSHCSAEIVTARSTVATTCAYCGRAISMTDKLVDNFKPDAVIPFFIDEKKANEIYTKYVHSHFLSPKNFRSESEIKKMKGVYVPFWLHTFERRSNVTVYGENIMSSRRGDDKIVDHHMYHVKIDASGTFKDVPTDALKNMDNTLMDALEPFDYSKLKDFNPAYMAGYYAEEYNEDEQMTLHRALERTKEAMLDAVVDEAGAYTVKRVQSSDEKILGVHAKYAMLPVWLLNVEYRKKDYLFAINGETGKIVGDLPMSGWKVFATLIGTFAGSFLIVALLFFLLLIGG